MEKNIIDLNNPFSNSRFFVVPIWFHIDRYFVNPEFNRQEFAGGMLLQNLSVDDNYVVFADTKYGENKVLIYTKLQNSYDDKININVSKLLSIRNIVDNLIPSTPTENEQNILFLCSFRNETIAISNKIFEPLGIVVNSL